MAVMVSNLLLSNKGEDKSELVKSALTPFIVLATLHPFLDSNYCRGGAHHPMVDGGKKTSNLNESALSILKKRYARGEIDQDTFEQMKRGIEGDIS